MISLKLPAPPEATQADARPRRTAVSTVAALALLILPVVTGCGQQSSTSSSSSSGGSASDPVVARVNGMDIRESDVAMAEEDLGGELQQIPPQQRREQIINYVADIMLAAQAAEGRNLQKSDEFRQREAFFRRKLLMGLLLQDHARTTVTDEALRKIYDEQIKP